MNSIQLEKLYALNQERQKLDKLISLLESGEANIFISGNEYPNSGDALKSSDDDTIVDCRRSILSILLERREELESELKKEGIEI